ncbi:caspase family protein [Moorena producens]|uniref:nSTAND1 domain-containing NTPase n=1 Tax=Moorena producens TaxID=1155739 RepID=UPI003C76B739
MSKHNFDRNFAVIIGINNYKNGIRKLETAEPDARKLAEIIQKQHQALKPQYQSQNEYEVKLFLNEDASLCHLKQLIVDFKQGQIPLNNEKVTVTTDDRLFFYFAGHGIALDALENQNGPVGYLIPQDARSRDSNTYLPMQDLHDALNELPCRHMLAILDCCFAGAFRWASLKREAEPNVKVYKERYDRFISDRAWQVITSAADDQKALDYWGRRGIDENDHNHSPFAKALFDALCGGADQGADLNQDGIITATELYSYLRDRVEILTEKHYQRQTPSLCPLRKHDKGEFIFLSPEFDRDKLEDAPPLNPENNPYRGLHSYDEKDSHLFFGREKEIKKLFEKIVANEQPLTLVLGASGTGKSSLVKAGLIPKLRQYKDGNTWFILPPFRPGEYPFTSLNNVLESVNQPLVATSDQAKSSGLLTPAKSLANWFKEHPQANLLLVIDQFEELITLCKSDEEPEQFQKLIENALAKYSDNIHVVITLRLDFEAQFQNSVLKDFWNDDTRFVVPPMTQDELREVIEKPASEKVVYFHPPSLVDELINDVVQMPGALPLLSFTLSELYLKYSGDRTRNNRALTKKDYEELGRVVGSITKRANQEYEKLIAEDSAYEKTVQRLMLRMISLQGGELARRQVPKSELIYPDEEENKRVEKVIKSFSEARLIVEGSNSQGEPLVEPAHEALVQGWDKLLVWKKEDEEILILQRRLTPAAVEWDSVKNNNKEQPKAFIYKVYIVLDWLDRRLFIVENLFNKIPTQLAGLLRRSPNQPGRYQQKPNQFLWNSNPYLGLLDQELHSDDNCLNLTEREFIQESVLQKRRNSSWLWRIVIWVILILSGLIITALIQWRISELNLANSLGRLSLSLFEEHKELDAFVEAIKGGKILQKHQETDLAVIRALQKLVNEGSERNRLERHNDWVLSVSFSSDGKTLASGSGDMTIKLWNLETGKEIHTLKGHDSKVKSVRFSPDAKTLASGSFDNTIKLWNLETGKEIHTLEGHDSQVNSISFSPDGKSLASGSSDKTIKLWNLDTGKEIRALQGHDDWVTSVSFSPDGKTLASGSKDKTIKLWNLEKGQEIRALQGHDDWVTSVSFSPNGKTLASGSYDKRIKLWNLKTGKEINTLYTLEIYEEHIDNGINSISYSPDGRILASGSRDQTITLWNLEMGLEIRTLRGHNDWVNSVSFSPDGKTLASGSVDKTIKFWSLETGKEVRNFQGHDLLSFGNIVSFSPNGKTLASGSVDKTIKLWNLETGKEIRALQGHDERVTSVSFSPDGKTLASGSEDKTIKLWNLETGKEIHTFKEHDSYVKSISFSPDGKTLASGSVDKTIKLWNLETGKEIYTLKGHYRQVNSVSFSPEGKILASGSADKTIKLWSLETGKGIRTLYHDYVTSVSFSPDRKTLASGSADKMIKLWNLETGQGIRTLQGHDDWVTSLSFSPDGKTLASGSSDRTIKLWDLKTGLEIHTLQGHYDGISSVSFSPDGKTLASGSSDKIIKLWTIDLNLDSLVRRSCQWVWTYLHNSSANINDSDRHLCDDVAPTAANPEK